MCALRLRASVLRTVGKSIDAVAGSWYRLRTQNVKPESMRERKEDENDAPAMHKYVAHAGAASATSKTCSLAPAAGAVLKSTVAAAVEDANSLDSLSMSPLFFVASKRRLRSNPRWRLERGDRLVFSCRASVYRDPNGRGSWTRCCTTTSLVLAVECNKRFGRCWR